MVKVKLMSDFYTLVILLINQLKKLIGEKQLSFFGSKGGQINPLMHVVLSFFDHKEGPKELSNEHSSLLVGHQTSSHTLTLFLLAATFVVC